MFLISDVLPCIGVSVFAIKLSVAICCGDLLLMTELDSYSKLTGLLSHYQGCLSAKANLGVSVNNNIRLFITYNRADTPHPFTSMQVYRCSLSVNFFLLDLSAFTRSWLRVLLSER